MKNSFKQFLGILLVMLLALSSFAQSKSKLEKERLQLQKEIKLVTGEYEKVKNDKKKSMDRIMWLQAQITLRQKLMNTISKEVKVMDSKIEETSNIVAALERDMKDLKEKYGDMLYNAYKYRSSIDQLIFIFSADNFNDAIQRMRYVQQISQFRKRQAELIDETSSVLNDKLEEQERIKAQKKALLDEKIQQKRSLNGEQEKKNQLISSLQDREKKLKKEIKKMEMAQAKLAKEIEKIIAAERAKPADANYAALSSSFAKNQGKLPWPAKGPIVRKFGEHPHHANPNVKINNDGIDIRTQEGSRVIAISEGEVRYVLDDPAFHMTVLIKHGEYYTLYNKMQDAFVKVGQKVVAGQEIGVAYTDAETGKTEVHLEIWKGMVKLNPAIWISKP